MVSLEKGLRTDRNSGLSFDEAYLDGIVSFSEAVKASHDNEPPKVVLELTQRTISGDTYVDRKRVFGTNHYTDWYNIPLPSSTSAHKQQKTVSSALPECSICQRRGNCRGRQTREPPAGGLQHTGIFRLVVLTNKYSREQRNSVTCLVVATR